MFVNINLLGAKSHILLSGHYVSFCILASGQLYVYRMEQVDAVLY